MTIKEYLKEKTTMLAAAGIEDAENEAWVCLLDGTGLSRSAFREDGRDIGAVLSKSQIDFLETLFARRAGHEPLAYIVGKAPFYDLEFSVGKGVLIPRFDTEILVETALGSLGYPVMLPEFSSLPRCEMHCNTVTNADISGLSDSFGSSAPKEDTKVRILDLCTGTGCVGITIAHELMKKGVAFDLVMTEISEEAASFARENASRILGDLSWKVEVVDLWPAVSDSEGGNRVSDEKDESAPKKVPAWQADILVSNPPYVKIEEMGELAPEVKDHEPALALTDQGDGLSLYRRIIEGVDRYLAPGGVLAVEHGCEQGAEVRKILETGLKEVMTIQDYGHLDRVTCGKRGIK